MATRRCAMTQIDLLLIGQTGSGKSSTGNSILMREVFKSESSCESVTSEIAFASTEYKGRTIQVVDTPGVGDTRLAQEEDDFYSTDDDRTDRVMNALQRAITDSDLGFHAFLLVLRFGDRFTKEEKKNLEYLSQVFGKDYLKKFAILVLTFGDSFRRESLKTGLTLEDWCKKQKGSLEDLYKECEYRAVLFDNVTEDDAQKEEQLDQLLELVDSLWTPGHRYRGENFEVAAQERKRIMVRSKLPTLRSRYMREIDSVREKLEATQDLESEQQEKPLKELVTRCQVLFNTLSFEDKGTDVLKDEMDAVKSLKKTAEDELKFCKRMAQKERRMAQQERKMQDEMENLRSQLARVATEEKEHHQRLEKKIKKGIAEKAVGIVTLPLTVPAKGIDRLGRKAIRKFKDK